MDKPGYPDLRAHIKALEEKGLLRRIKRPINKDTEMHPLVRWQFRGGIPEEERKGFLLRPKFVFIDGRSGATMYSESYREEVLYNAQQSTPALSSYFELMDRLVPNFLSTLSSQKVRGTRVLLK